MKIEVFVPTATIYDLQGRFVATVTTHNNEPANWNNLKISSKIDGEAAVIVATDENGVRHLLKNRWGDLGTLEANAPIPRKPVQDIKSAKSETEPNEYASLREAPKVGVLIDKEGDYWLFNDRADRWQFFDKETQIWRSISNHSANTATKTYAPFKETW